jgi:hypothetical protein
MPGGSRRTAAIGHAPHAKASAIAPSHPARVQYKADARDYRIWKPELPGSQLAPSGVIFLMLAVTKRQVLPNYDLRVEITRNTVCGGVEKLMSDAKVRGIVHVVEETKTYGQKGFRKRLVVLEQDNGRFASYIPVEFIQDGCDQADGLSVGDDVEITYRLNGRKWQRDPSSEVKYFLSAEAIDYRVLGGGGDASADISGDPNADLNEAALEDDEDVPF